MLVGSWAHLWVCGVGMSVTYSSAVIKEDVRCLDLELRGERCGREVPTEGHPLTDGN